MKTGKIWLALAVLAGTLAVSCKKDDQTTTYASFSGSVRIAGNLPRFVRAGEKYALTASGISRSDGGDYGIYWTYTTSDDRDTTKKVSQATADPFIFEVPDTLCTITVRSTFFASGYYTSSGSVRTTVISRRSLKGRSFTPVKLLIDSRDNHRYYFTTAGGLDWMAENLSHGPEGGLYENSDAMEDVFGRYYTWAEARSACPEGWRLPTEAEWEALCGDGKDAVKDLISAATFNYVPMWDYWPNVGDPTLKYGFEALPSGYATVADGVYSFPEKVEFAAYWTADEADEDHAIYKYFHEKNPDLMTGRGDKESFAATVRCVR